MKKVSSILMSLSLMVQVSCGEKKSSSGDDNDSTGSSVSGTSTSQVVSGSLEISGATHVYAVAPGSSKQELAEVQSDGSFELNVDSKTPYSLSVVDSSKTGTGMVVGRFTSSNLDSIATGSSADTAVSLGTLSISTALTASGDPIVVSSTSHADLVTQMGLSSDAATTLGNADDAMGRYASPDIDCNGVLDKSEGASFPLDFHNRFSAVDSNGANYDPTAMKNTFLPADTNIEYQSTGIIPQFDLKDKITAAGSYSWTFETETELHSNGCTEGSLASGDTLPANTKCSVTGADSSYTDQGAINVQKTPPTGLYLLNVGSENYRWPSIKFNDLSAGSGFLAIFTKYNVDDAGKLQSMSFEYRMKGSDGTYAIATQDAIDLLVKDGTGYVSLKIDGSSDAKSIGFKIPLEPSSTVEFSSLSSSDVQGVDISEVTSGIDFTRVLENPGISYDDKLGMRFFF